MEQEALHRYLADRPCHELRKLQKALNCRVEGKRSRNRDLILAIEADLPSRLWRKANNSRGLCAFLLHCVATIIRAYNEFSS
jgi:hypothetical protein